MAADPRRPPAEDPISIEEQSRADVYRLLGALLAAAPGEEVLSLVQGMHGYTGGASSPLIEAVGDLKRAAETASVESLGAEYYRLFIGLGRGELVPYASWYLTGYLMETPLAALRQELQRIGIERQAAISEPEDHVAALCEVMGMIICENVLQFDEQKTFFETYIGSWMGRFFADLRQADAAVFYSAVGALGERFMGVETTYFAMPA
jgi:TorA maturation chaperone TorD